MQQAISDWQAWAETKNAELLQYSEAYNTANADLVKSTEAANLAQQETEVLKDKISQFEAEKLELDNQILTLKADLEAAKNDVANVKQETMTLAQSEDYDNEIAELKTEINTTIQANQQIEAELKVLREKLAEEESKHASEIADLKSQTSGPSAVQDENERLQVRVGLLGRKYSELEGNFSQLQLRNKELESSVSDLTAEKERLAAEVTELREALDAVKEDKELLQNVEIENARLKTDCESLKLRLEAFENEKEGVTANQDYANFQQLNQNLQLEITGLRDYIQQQTVYQESIQQQYQQLQAAVATGGAAAAAGDQQVAFERQLIQKLEQDLQVKDAALRKAEEELDRLKSSPIPERTRKHSKAESTSSEVSQYFVDSENDRLKQDLDKSVMENRLLTRQMENWKQQLSDVSVSALEEDADDDSDDPVVLKAKQDQAWRSVGALQLRVEQLTLEVTKVRNKFLQKCLIC